ncbi:MAG: radical SAM protein [Acidobacteriota bacterium]
MSSSHRLRRRLQSETSLVPFNPGAPLRVVLAYPNTYAVGMSNLGVQTLYRLLNARPEVCCERLFLPDAEQLARFPRRSALLPSLETQRPVINADLLALSVSFENDYPNLLTLLALAGLPLRASERGEEYPLVAMGGATVSINPEPVAPFVDLCCIGEGEELVEPLVEALLGHHQRRTLLEKLCTVPGFYVPSLYQPSYGDEHATSRPHGDVPPFVGLTPQAPAPATIRKVRATFGGVESVAATSVLSPETQFGDRAMIEVARGCTKGCRYCWVGYNILPFRVHAVDDILAVAEQWRQQTERVGLVATALLDHPEIVTIAEGLRGRGFAVFSPSLIISTLQEPLLRAVIESGQKSITIAPETGSDRLRQLIMKKISNEEILEKVRMLFRTGAHSLKCYIIIGLPGETEADLGDLIDLAAQMQAIMVDEGRARGSIGTITLSVNCLIPKPGTPFQWVEQIRPQVYRAKLRWLRRRIAHLPNVSLEAMSPRSAEVQGVLSRGDRRVAALLEQLFRCGSWSQAVRRWESEGGSLAHFAYRAYAPTEPLPWAHLRIGASPTALQNQWQRALKIDVGAAA